MGRLLVSVLLVIGGFSAEAAGTSPSLPAGTLLFHRNVIHDTQGTGLDAFTVSVPDGWQGQGQVTWNLRRTVAPSDLSVHLANSQGSEEFSYFPSLLFIWSPLYQQYSAQMGGQVQGCPIVQPANGPVAAIQSVVLPTYLGNLNGQYTVISSQELPQMAAAYAPTYNQPGQQQGTVRAGTERIEYTQNGRVVQQDIYCVFVLASGPNGYVWGLDHVVSFKADKGVLDQSGRKFALVAASLLPTPQFLDALDKVTSLLIQQFNQNEAALMQRVAIEEKAQQQISQQIMSGWESRQAASDAAIENYDAGAIRGVVNETDPHTGAVVQIPDDATKAWSDSAGDILYTDSANFNPSQYKNADWQALTPTPH